MPPASGAASRAIRARLTKSSSRATIAAPAASAMGVLRRERQSQTKVPSPLGPGSSKLTPQLASVIGSSARTDATRSRPSRTWYRQVRDQTKAKAAAKATSSRPGGTALSVSFSSEGLIARSTSSRSATVTSRLPATRQNFTTLASSDDGQTSPHRGDRWRRLYRHPHGGAPGQGG